MENNTSSETPTNPILTGLIYHNPVIIHPLNLTEDSVANLIYSRPSSSSDECEVVVVEKCFTQQTQKCVTTYVKENIIVILLSLASFYLLPHQFFTATE